MSDTPSSTVATVAIARPAARPSHGAAAQYNLKRYKIDDIDDISQSVSQDTVTLHTQPPTLC